MDILTTFRTIVPEFASKTDNEILTMFELVKPQLSKNKLGSLYYQAASYLIAHYFAWNNLIVTGGSTSGSATSGQVVSEKEGDLSRTYAQNNSSSNSGIVETFERTAYGQEYKRILRMKIFPATTRRFLDGWR